MINPMQIPEIISEVVKHLDTQELAAASAVNKTWRLEARKKLYQNRRVVIYSILKKHLDAPRRSRHLDLELIEFIPLRVFMRLDDFRRTIDLDIKKELLTIRKQLQKKHERAKNLSDKLDMELPKKRHLIDSHVIYSKDYCKARDDYCKTKWKLEQSDKQWFEIYKDYVNFEYFLLKFRGEEYFTDREVDNILDRLDDLSCWEYELAYEAANSISSIFTDTI